jgi:hypothetical protein
MDSVPSWLQIFASWAAILTLLFAVFSYWHNWYLQKRKVRNKYRSLKTELRTIYITARKEIIQYDEVRTKKYNQEFRASVYHCPILKWLVNSGEVTDYFKTIEEVSGLIGICNIVNLINTIDPVGLKRPDPKILDFYFEKRLVELRELILEVASYDNNIDMCIMPVEYKGNLRTTHHTGEYHLIQQEEEKAYNIIQKTFPTQRIRKVPEQYFGEGKHN